MSTKHQIILSLRTLKRILKKNGLFRRIHFDSLEETVGFIKEQLQGSGALHGYRWMYAKCKENGLHIRKEDVSLILSTLDPEGTETGRSRGLHRRAYFSKGPNYVWHVDSYDKLKPFGICINGAIDGFSRKILRLNAYHTSSDPKVIGGYFLQSKYNFVTCVRKWTTWKLSCAICWLLCTSPQSITKVFFYWTMWLQQKNSLVCKTSINKHIPGFVTQQNVLCGCV